MTDTGAPDIFDLTIIGGGPVGLFGAYYAGMRRMRTKILDSLEELGGQLTTLYPEKYIYDVAGFPKVLARDLSKSLIEQAMQYSPAIALGQTVQTLERREDLGCYVVRSDKAVHYTRTLVISAGAGALQPKKLPVPGLERFEGRGVYYSVRSKAEFAGKRVLVIGGGDSAVDWSLNLLEVASHITLIHRRNQFRAHEDLVRKLQSASDAQILTFFELKEVVAAPGSDKVEGATIVNNQTKEERTLAVDAILAQLGFVGSLGPIKDWPIQIQRGAIVVDSHMETILPGIFAAGDVAAYEGKLKLIATGFGEAAVAVNFAKTRIDPKAKAFPGHSSEMTPQAVVTL